MFRFLLLLFPASLFAVEPVQVFVSIAPQKYLVEYIGRDMVNVNVMLSPGESPETFDPTLKQISELEKAQLYFRIGVEFEKKWLDGINENRTGIQILDCCKNIIESRSIALDAHVWTSVRNAGLLAAEIKKQLSNADPARAEYYENNYLELADELEQLDSDIYSLLSNRRTDYFVISHAALGHFAADYGLVQLSLENEGKELGARSLVDIVRQAQDEKITTLLVQKQHKSAAALAFANEIKARVVEIDVQDGDYLNNLRDISKVLAEALR